MFTHIHKRQNCDWQCCHIVIKFILICLIRLEIYLIVKNVNCLQLVIITLVENV